MQAACNPQVLGLLAVAKLSHFEDTFQLNQRAYGIGKKHVGLKTYQSHIHWHFFGEEQICNKKGVGWICRLFLAGEECLEGHLLKTES